MHNPRKIPVANSLPCWLALCEVNGAANGAAMKPSIRVDTDGFSGELLELSWPLDRLEQGQEAYTASAKGRATTWMVRKIANGLT